MTTSQALFQFFDAHDDVRIINNDLTAHSGLTLCAMAKNELYFIQAFFDHYRSLGVERFIILDDYSDDGTREFLFQQADCMVLGSQKTYGQVISRPSFARNPRIHHIWLNILTRKYTIDRWTLLVDIDEFLRLPDGMTLQELISRLEAAHFNAVWGIMLDLYPARFADLVEMSDEPTINLEREWFFDGCPHLVLPNSHSYPQTIYSGSRARLMRQFRIPKKRSFIRRLFSRKVVSPHNTITKLPLFKLPEDGYFSSIHEPVFPRQTHCILPLEHYKFSGQTSSRIQFALTSKAHHKRSMEYEYLDRLLSKMEQEQASFLCSYSTRKGSFQTYLEAGVPQGFHCHRLLPEYTFLN